MPAAEPSLTISHRWASLDMIMITWNTIKEFNKNNHIGSLSHVFQNALYTTFALGYSYIWIDSLCIPKVMEIVYPNAVCSLAASDLENSEEGLLNDSRKHNPIPVVVSPTWSVIPPGESAVHVVSDYHTKAGIESRRFVLTNHYLEEQVCNGPTRHVSAICRLHPYHTPSAAFNRALVAGYQEESPGMLHVSAFASAETLYCA